MKKPKQKDTILPETKPVRPTEVATPARPEPSGVLVGEPLSVEDVVAVALMDAPVALSPRGLGAIETARATVEALLHDDAGPTYGINTGFGALAEVRIPPDQLEDLQHNLLRSHAVGVGPPLERKYVRAMMLLRAQVLALGYSGVRPVVVERLIEMINRRVHPVIPSQGSVGACGDLAPLAHLALVLTGEGEATYHGELVPGGRAMTRAGLAPIRLAAKEGLSLINGTQGMLAIGSLSLARAELLSQTADVTGAMTVEALKGSVRPFDAAIVEARPHPGALAAAAHLQGLLADSQTVLSHADCKEVQDAYSLRCMPQVHGATRDMLAHVRRVLEIELNSATDNPLVLGDGRIQSGGNFHGQPVAAALDAAVIAMVDLASISERRIAQLVDPHLNRGMPAFLSPHSGLNSGFMMAQVTAASLVSEAKAMAFPKSVDTIPTSADREDHVSMGMTSARTFDAVNTLVGHVLAIEAMVAGQGISMREPTPGRGVAGAVARLREVVPFLENDRALHIDIAAARDLVTTGDLLNVADAALG